MDDAQLLKRLMTRAADKAVPPFEAPPADRFVGQPHPRRRARLSIAAAVLAVLALLVPVTLLARSPVHNSPSGTPNTLPTLGSVSAASLAHYTWSTLPAAPIASRRSAVGVWTGTQMIVWGGATDDGTALHADGAAYNPDTKAWSRLPSSPLSARSQSASVWTGTSVFIWGGSVDSDATLATDGALYTPADHRWTRVPAAPVTDYGAVHAFWSGSVVVLLSTPPGRADKGSGVVNTQSYDPATHTWTRLPDLQLPAGHAADEVIDVGAGSQIYVWSLWSHTTSTGPGVSRTIAGVDAYTLDLGRRRWVPNTLALADQAMSSTPLWTGRDIAMPAVSRWLGAGNRGPRPQNLSGVMLDPSNSATRPIRHGPVDDLNAQYLWAGSALLAFNTGTQTSGPGGHVYPGRAAAWDPATNTWTTLPNAPLAGSDVIAVWTGKALLIWGELYTPHGARHMATTGLELAP
jgi:hypothetical protein